MFVSGGALGSRMAPSTAARLSSAWSSAQSRWVRTAPISPMVGFLLTGIGSRLFAAATATATNASPTSGENAAACLAAAHIAFAESESATEAAVSKIQLP